MTIKQYLDRYLDNPLLFNFVRHLLDGGQIAHISRVLSGVPHRRVLDIACGTGDVSRAIQTDYVGIDLCELFITYANRRYGNARKQFLVMDVTDVRLPEKSFDLAMIVNVIHHFEDALVLRILEQAARLARGHVLLIDAIPKRNVLSRMLYALDRGDHFRSFEEQKTLVGRTKSLKLVLEDSYESTSRLYRHSVLLCRVADNDSSITETAG